MTPPDTAGYVQVQVTTPVGPSPLTAAAGYIYVGLGNYTPLSPFRILDTRSGGTARAGYATRTLQVSGVGAPAIPATAVAVVLNVTEVNGSQRQPPDRVSDRHAAPERLESEFHRGHDRREPGDRDARSRAVP